MAQSFNVTYRNSSVACYKFGFGEKLVFCFHGYGEDGNSFSFLEKYAGAQYSFIAFDLPFHGNTQWHDEEFTTADLVNIIRQLVGADVNHHTKKISLLGFSLGGRVALSLYQSMPSEIDKIVLLAPDGLKINFWYWLATQTIAGNSLFAFTMKHPGWFFGFLKFLNALGLVNRSIFKFVHYYIGDSTVRKLLYQRWIGLRKLKPNLERIRAAVISNNSRVHLLYGKHDRIILPNPGERFCKGLENNCTISIIHSGHQVLHENHIAEILPALMND